MLRTQLLNLADREPDMDRAVPFPEDDPRLVDVVWRNSAPDFVRIPDNHLVERYSHLVSGVAAEMLIRKKQDLLAALPRPFQGSRCVRRRADHTAALADERLNRSRRV